MKKQSILFPFLIAGVAAFSLAGCEGNGHDDDDHADHDHADHDQGDADHPDGHGDDDHAHADDDGHHDEAHAHELGTQSAGGFDITVTQFGHVEAGEEAALEIHIDGEAADDPDSFIVRAWIGTSEGHLFLKSKADAEDDHYHGHVEVPSPLEDGYQWWIEVENEDGEVMTVSFPIGDD